MFIQFDKVIKSFSFRLIEKVLKIVPKLAPT